MVNIHLSNGTKRALWGGIIAASSIGIGIYYLGSISQHEAKDLLNESLPGFNMLCNTIVLASATILALLLSLLGISSSSKSRLKAAHYKQVALLAKWDAINFIAAIILFQFSNIPMTEADNFPASWYSILYWSTLVISSLLCGGIVSVILMLYNTVINMVYIIGMGITDHPLIQAEEDEDEND